MMQRKVRQTAVELKSELRTAMRHAGSPQGNTHRIKIWPTIVSSGYPGGWGDANVQAHTTISPLSPPTTVSGAEYK